MPTLRSGQRTSSELRPPDSDRYPVQTTINDLPDELILEIMKNFQASRRLTARFHSHDKLREKDNRARKGCLWSLSLTSKRMSRVVTPLLYSAVIVRSSREDPQTELPLLARTLIKEPQLALNIRYVENFLEDGADQWTISSGQISSPLAIQNRVQQGMQLIEKAKEFWTGDTLQDWISGLSFFPEQSVLALIIAMAANVAHMTLEIVDTGDLIIEPSFYIFLGIKVHDGFALPLPAFHCFDKLQSLRLSNKTLRNGSDPTWSARPEHYLQRLPSLKHYEQAYCKSTWPGPGTSDTLSLNVLHFTSCYPNVALVNIAQTVKTCKTLSEFSFGWARRVSTYGVLDGADYAHLHEALVQHQDNLEYFELDWCLPFGQADMIPNPTAASFAKFTKLKTLIIPTVFLMGRPSGLRRGDTWTYHKAPHRFSECLPSSLETLILRSDPIHLSDDSRILQELVEDLSSLPSLKDVRIESRNPVRFTKLAARFQEHGVAFTVQQIMPKDDFEKRLEVVTGSLFCIMSIATGEIYSSVTVTFVTVWEHHETIRPWNLIDRHWKRRWEYS
ncbi:hypothetical protein K504DRAFT_501449 [Pleomassaria siparia CBS 279.74]|uniref:Uncharacterized protein n=1 Tax=Pleomassaria siparia CBS 279.74 TaxID=1314801 RepID=A0A6G1KCU7_9PLEO|nr:hypothetical protein K504DRAFT_501449 [Pleomassaria siparia CBS 279.74]